MKKKVLLIGGRSKAKSLAASLLKRGYQVTAINSSYEDCVMLATLRELSVIHGDGTKPYILEDAGAAGCEIAIALMAKDEDNLVACELCKKWFEVKKTVALVSDARKASFFYKMGIDGVVCAISAVTSIIEEQAFMEEMAQIVPLGEGQVQIAEVPVPRDAAVVGKRLWEISLPTEVLIGCILRAGATIIPRGDTRILAGDRLVVISGSGHEKDAIKELTSR